MTKIFALIVEFLMKLKEKFFASENLFLQFLKETFLFPDKKIIKKVPGERIVKPKDYGQTFDPSVHPDLPKAQENAVNDLFAYYKQAWIPGDYLSILKNNPDPIVALRKFCALFGIDQEKIRIPNDPEIMVLDRVIGMLIHIGELKLSVSDKTHIYGLFPQKRFAEIEKLIDRADMIVSILNKAIESATGVNIAVYSVFVDEEILPFRNTIFEITDKQLARIEKIHGNFVKLNALFGSLFHRCVGNIEWIEANWPPNRAFFGRNSPIVGSAKREIGEIAGKITTDKKLSSKDLDGLIENMRAILMVLQDVVKEIGGAGPSMGHDPKTTAEREARVFFGFDPDSNPKQAEIKSAFRKIMTNIHPDKVKARGGSDEEIAAATKMTQKANEHRSILNKIYKTKGEDDE